MQEIFYIVALSLGAVLVIFVLTKLMGYRQVAQMSMFDYVNGITIGSIAAEMSTSLDESFVQPLTAMIVFAGVDIFLSWITSKSMKTRKIVEGTPLVLMNHGEIYRENLKKAKMDINEFLVQCRVSGYFDVAKLETAILEGNGRISFLPKVAERPLTPGDMELLPQQEHMVANVIIDGKIMKENLKHTGNEEGWLMHQIKGQGADKAADVLLATCDSQNTVTVFLKETKKNKEEVLM